MWLKYDSYFDAFTTKKYAVYGKRCINTCINTKIQYVVHNGGVKNEVSQTNIQVHFKVGSISFYRIFFFNQF